MLSFIIGLKYCGSRRSVIARVLVERIDEMMFLRHKPFRSAKMM